jgi:hypothetical protein
MADGETIANGQPRTLGVVKSYDDLHQLLRARAEELNVSRQTLDEAAGLTPGHASKLLSPTPIKKLGAVTMTLMLQVLGVRLIAQEDVEALAQLKRFPTREVEVPARSVPWGRKGTQAIVSMRFVRRIARAGGQARARALTAAQRSVIASQAAKARWRRRKVKR